MSELRKDCLFCKIIRNEVTNFTVFENQDIKVFLDQYQITPGHLLMIPKRHIVDIFDYTQEDAERYFKYIPQISRAIRHAFPRVTGMHIKSNNGVSARQTVPHSHIHFIPRFAGDGMVLRVSDRHLPYDEKEYQKIANQIKQQF